MKGYGMLLLVFFVGCKPATKATSETQTAKSATTTTTTTKAIMAINDKTLNAQPMLSCPEDGQCQWELIPNKSLLLNADSIGTLYPTFESAEETHVLRFEYVRNSNPKLPDSGYKELVLLEIPKALTTLTLLGEDLQQAKVTHARLCFCRGASGYFPITQGQLRISKRAQNYEISLQFENTQVPQVLRSLSGTLHESL